MSNKKDDITPLEYLVVALAVLAFGLLYFFINHGSGFWSKPPTLVGASPDGGETALVGKPLVLPMPDVAGQPDKPLPNPVKGEPRTGPVVGPELVVSDVQPEIPALAPAPAPELAVEEAATVVAPVADNPDSAKPGQIMSGKVVRAPQAVVPPQPDSTADTQAATEPLPEVVLEQEGTLPTVEIVPEPLPTPDSGPAVALPVVGSEFERSLEGLLAGHSTGLPLVFDHIAFDSGSADLSGSSQTQIEATAALLAAYPDTRILLRGHTDSTGGMDANSLLSLSRSVSLKNALVAAGMDAARIGVEGVGALEPTAPNATEEGRQANRRIELVIVE